jgi:hypothetical protein
MNVAAQFRVVTVEGDQYCFEAALEEGTDPPVFAIKPNTVGDVEPLDGFGSGRPLEFGPAGDSDWASAHSSE